MKSVRTLLLLAVAVLVTAACKNTGPEPRQGCEMASCHGVEGVPSGIERAHVGIQLLCTDCHGGDGTTADKLAAHVAPAPAFVADRNGYLKNLAVDQLDQVAPAYMRFVNPGDFRVASTGCGASSPAAAGSGCHETTVYNASRSVMSTFVGHFNVPRFQAGLQGREAILGSRDLADPLRPDPPPMGTVPELTQAACPVDGSDETLLSTALDHYLPKNCTHCHSWSYGRNDAPGNFRSSGCTACHMLYANNGRSVSSDPSAIRDRPPHPKTHEIVTAIDDTQCEHCHYQGARIGLLYRGVIEWGFDDQTPPFPALGEPLHGHDGEFYRQGATPDLHYEAGMMCVDCHVGRDVHGDGRIYSTSKFQVSVRCENCHGNIDSPVVEGRATPPLIPGGVDFECAGVTGDSGHFLNCNGDPLKRMYRAGDGSIWMRLANGQGNLEVPQVATRLAEGDNQAMVDAMGRNPETGFSHTEKIECHGCHTEYRQYCFGCHVTLDYSQTKIDLLSGQPTRGVELVDRSFTSLDLYFVGENRRGKIASFCPSMQVFTSAVDRDAGGNYFSHFQDRTRKSAGGSKVGFNWAVDTPHVVSRVPQGCARCHADSADNCSVTQARQTYGFGTGRYTWTDEDGKTHDLTQMLDTAGNPIVSYSHVGQGPVPIDSINRALAICPP